MDLLPKDIEDIIIDYKEQLERSEYEEKVRKHRFKNIINLNRIKYLKRYLDNRGMYFSIPFFFIILDNMYLYDNKRYLKSFMVERSYSMLED